MKSSKPVLTVLTACFLLAGLAATNANSATPARRRALQAQPTPLAPLKLSGRLVFTENQGDILQLDMATGVFSTIFAPPPDGYVMAAAVSPHKAQIAMAYQPPPVSPTPGTLPRYAFTHIYPLPTHGSAQKI